MPDWTSQHPMPTPRHDLCAIAVDTHIYAISGADDLTLDVVEIYDTETDQWRQGTPIPTKRGWAGSVLLDEKIYVIGGKTVRTPEEKARTGDDAHYTIQTAVEAYDLQRDTWLTCPPLSEPRAGLAVTACRGLIYAIGGNNMREGRLLDRVDVFDPDHDVWSPGPSLPLPIQGAAVATIDDCIYIAGGFSDIDPSRYFRNETYRFDPSVNRWEPIAPIPTARCSLASAMVDRRLYTIGGRGPAGYYHDAIEVYDSVADTWAIADPLPEGKAWAGAASVDERIYVMGGADKGADGAYRWLDTVHALVV